MLLSLCVSATFFALLRLMNYKTLCFDLSSRFSFPLSIFLPSQFIRFRTLPLYTVGPVTLHRSKASGCNAQVVYRAEYVWSSEFLFKVVTSRNFIPLLPKIMSPDIWKFHVQILEEADAVNMLCNFSQLLQDNFERPPTLYLFRKHTGVMVAF